MATLSRYRIILAAVAIEAGGAAAFMMQGCGDDNQVDAGDSGPDVTKDAKTDGPNLDSGKDVGIDSPADAPADVGPDGPPAGLTFAISEATTICQNWFKCCPQDAGYDLNACIAGIDGLGWEHNLSINNTVYGRGHVGFDADAGAACLAAINSFSCTQNASYWASVTNACQHVFTGTLPSGQGGCVSSFECAPSNFCDPTVDGGLCSPVRAQGQPCNDKLKGYTVADQECSYLSSTQSGLFCDIVDNDGGYGGSATCQPAQSAGASCCNGSTFDYTDLACSSLLCGDDCKCGDTATYPVIAGTCDFYKIQDAGTD